MLPAKVHYRIKRFRRQLCEQERPFCSAPSSPCLPGAAVANNGIGLFAVHSSFTGTVEKKAIADLDECLGQHRCGRHHGHGGAALMRVGRFSDSVVPIRLWNGCWPSVSRP